MHALPITDATAAVAHPITHPCRMSGADAIVRILAEEAVPVLFGYTGGAILPVFDALYRYNASYPAAEGVEPMRLIVPASEQGAGFMAAGYARASGKVGVAIVTSGPGATNMVTPVRDSMADSIPMVVICGQVPTTAIGSDAFQEAPVSAIMGPCAKHVFLVSDASRLEAMLRSAFDIARSGRPGPVVIDIPKNVQNAELLLQGVSAPAPWYPARPHALFDAGLGDSACSAFLDALARASRPLVYAGGGVIRGHASAALRRFAQALGLPVTTTLMGLGAYDTIEPLALHMLGMHGTAYANYAVEDCDFLLALGARFDDRVAGVPDRFAPNARFLAQIDIDASEIGKIKRVDWHHVGQLAPALDELTDYAAAHGFAPERDGRYAGWHAHIAELKRRHAMDYDRTSPLIQPQAVIEEINRHTQGRAVISTGVGQHQMWAAQYFDFREPRHWLSSGSMGTMGFGLPAAIGAQFARSDALVIDIDGDASIRMNLGELETVTTYGLPVKVVVLNNIGDGMVRQWQKLFFECRFIGCDKSERRKDFVKAAQADGFDWARRLERKEDMASTIADFLAYPGPAFLEVMIDPEASVYPVVGPGASYAQMITGEHIPSRLAPAPPATESPDMF